MLTQGQASCYIYGLEPTNENKILAKERLKLADLTAVTLANHDPYSPFAMGRDMAKKLPWKYIECPSSPVYENLEGEEEIIVSNDTSETTDSNEDSEDNLGKTKILNIIKNILFPSHKESKLFNKVFMTNKDIHTTIKGYIPNLDKLCTPFQLSRWMSMDGTWGELSREIVNGKRSYGRWINLLDKKYICLNESKVLKSYRKMIISTEDTFKNIGYCRKSNTIENDEAHNRLLMAMIERLKKKMLCTEVFTSYRTNADTPLFERDKTIKKIDGSAGSIKDMMEQIAIEYKKIRLVIIDYAGLSTNPDDIRGFIR
ncbi:hypothetical protein BJ944DRAFT_270606 [Cunninghamella echinulata]|nr:hypothetical protein BJ944DRAFT_270606 [Cunninghamella echinulata]